MASLSLPGGAPVSHSTATSVADAWKNLRLPTLKARLLPPLSVMFIPEQCIARWPPCYTMLLNNDDDCCLTVDFNTDFPNSTQCALSTMECFYGMDKRATAWNFTTMEVLH